MAQTTLTERVKIEQYVPTAWDATSEAVKRGAAEWRRLAEEQAVDGYYFTCSYRGIITFGKARGHDRVRHPDRHFTTNAARQLVPCDLWGYALTATV